jgi:hypothetical protein
MQALDELLARPLEITSPLAADVAADEARIALSATQFGALDLLSAQRRALVLGVAGSGKTLLAAEKARRLAAQGFKVLLTCFNRPLAEHLAATIGQLEGVTVRTFHGLAEELGREARLIGPNPAHDTAYFDELPNVLDQALRALPERRFDAIVVDEGQDLDAVWWLPLLDLLRDWRSTRTDPSRCSPPRSTPTSDHEPHVDQVDASARSAHTRSRGAVLIAVASIVSSVPPSHAAQPGTG